MCYLLDFFFLNSVNIISALGTIFCVLSSKLINILLLQFVFKTNSNKEMMSKFHLFVSYRLILENLGGIKKIASKYRESYIFKHC